jgi:hypothetical protein
LTLTGLAHRSSASTYCDWDFDMLIKHVFAAALVLAASGANAATIELLESGPESNSSLTGEFYGAGLHDVTGSYYGYGPISPWAGTETPNASYTTVVGSVSSGSQSHEVIQFDTAQESLNLLWGTPSSTDYVSFALTDGSYDFVSGSSISAGGYYQITPSQSFTSVTFTSKSSPFEYTAVQANPVSEVGGPGDVSPVPLPAAGMMLAAAVVGLRALARRRRS